MTVAPEARVPASLPWLPPALAEAPDDPPNAPRVLDALLSAIDRQRRLLAGDIDRVWDDAFIESCDDWAVPYIAALVGLPVDASRLEVAYAIALRRRKGTPAALEDFAQVLTGWAAVAVEGWQVTLWIQRLGHPPPPRLATLDVRHIAQQRVGTAFERARRSVSPGGRWSPRAATAVVWPWRSTPLRAVEAAPLAVAGANRFALHPLGAEAPLYLRPRPLQIASDADARTAVTGRTGSELDAPVRATYHVMQALAADGDITYGGTLQLAATHPLAPTAGSPDPPLVALDVGGTAVAWNKIRFGSVPDGSLPPFPPAGDEVIIDPARGRLEVGAALAANGPPRATWYRPVAGSIGALANDAAIDQSAPIVVSVNPAFVAGPTVVHTIAAAFTAAESLSVASGLTAADSRPGRPDVEIRLDTSDRLAAPGAVAFAPTLPRWRIVAPAPSLPAVIGDVDLDLDGGCLTLEGFMLSGDLRLGPGFHGVTLRSLTMNTAAGKTVFADPAAWRMALDAHRCLLGAIRADLAAESIRLRDCVVDAFGASLRVCGGAPGGTARDAVTRVNRVGPSVVADGVTFVGAVRADALDAVDSVLVDGAEVVQQQEGCIRYCYIGPDPGPQRSLPALYRCGPFPPPTFASVGFDAAGYYALALEPDHPLLEAASDGGEVGAYHRDKRAARIDRLRARVTEFVPLGLRAHVALAPWEE